MPEQKPAVIVSHHAHTTSHRRNWLISFFLLILLCGGVYGVYLWQHGKVQQSSYDIANLSSQVSKLKSQISATTAINNGTVESKPQQTSANGKLSLDDDKVSLTLPANWVRSTYFNTACSLGTIDAKVICEDVTAVLPNSLNTKNSSDAFSVNISVFDHTDSTRAKDWLDSNKDYAAEFSQIITPQATNQSAQPINGYDAYTFTTQDSSIYYSYITYGLVHANLAVVVRSTYKISINQSGKPGDDIKKDYSNYLPDIKSLVNSIKFNN